MIESWRRVWRTAAELLSLEELTAVRRALAEDDPRLLQGMTTTPPPLACVQDWDVEGACLLGYAGWQGNDLVTVAEVEEFFARMCYEIDQRLGEPAGCRWFLNWFDETPRDEMRHQLLTEVERSIHERGKGMHDAELRQGDEVERPLSVLLRAGEGSDREGSNVVGGAGEVRHVRNH